uniref:Putative secreted protein n=1 Tax=Anopheles darlingi TaxID=43151 RepID=A0A2M4D656_ANODA
MKHSKWFLRIVPLVDFLSLSIPLNHSLRLLLYSGIDFRNQHSGTRPLESLVPLCVFNQPKQPDFVCWERSGAIVQLNRFRLFRLTLEVRHICNAEHSCSRYATRKSYSEDIVSLLSSV